MATIVRVSNPPNEGPVIEMGAPVAGEWCRITTPTGTATYQRYTPPPPPPPSQASLAVNGPDQRRAMVRGRARDLDKRGKYLEANALRATIGE